MPVVLTAISGEPLDLAAHLGAVDDARQGACATFVGTVRNHDPEAHGTVTWLDYTAHPTADAALLALAEETLAELDADDVARVAVSHRVGRVAVGESAIVAAVSTPHRRLAFEICGHLVERIKHELPIWKEQHTEDGSSTWSGLPA